MNDLVVRAAADSDLDDIMVLAAQVAEAPKWTRGDYAAALEPGEAPGLQRGLWVGHVRGELVGYAVAECLLDQAELQNIAVRATWRRQGFARALCMRVTEWAVDCGADVLALEVRSRSEGARSLYAGLGFCEDGLRRGYYRDPVDDAVLMMLPLRTASGTQIYNGRHGS